MRVLIPLLTLFAILTQPDGYAIRIAKAQVVAVFRAVQGECGGYGPRNDAETHAILMMGNGSRLCVAEHPDTAAAEIDK